MEKLRRCTGRDVMGSQQKSMVGYMEPKSRGEIELYRSEKNKLETSREGCGVKKIKVGNAPG